MWIGVKETIHKDLFAEALNELGCDLFPGCLKWYVRRRHSRHILHDEQTRRGVITVNIRNSEPREAGHRATHPFGVHGLLAKVEFPAQRRRQMCKDRRQVNE